MATIAAGASIITTIASIVIIAIIAIIVIIAIIAVEEEAGANWLLGL